MVRRNILVVGAGLGAFRVAEQLRRRGFDGDITVLGGEPHLPYDRPPLSKQVLRGESDTTAFAGADDLDVQWVLGTRALSLDIGDGAVQGDNGETYRFSTLILAPGGSPRTLPHLGAGPGLHVMRTIDDAKALRAALGAGSRLIVIGGGFIGCEIAASARQVGASVDLVEALPAPLVRVLGPVAAAKVKSLHEDKGVRLHTGVTVSGVLRDDGGRLRGIRLADGTEIEGDEIVVGIGIAPDVDWLAGSGLVIEDGIVCDDSGRTSSPDIFALGDAASWWHDLAGGHRRIEHWTTTTDQAAAIAATIAGDAAEPAAKLVAAPYFWSDQFDVKIQGIGFIDPADEVTELSIRDRPVLLYAREGVVRGVVGFSIPGAVMRTKALIERRATLQEAVDLLTA